jgi:hypothetical protein
MANINNNVPLVQDPDFACNSRELYCASVVYTVLGGGVEFNGEFTFVDQDPDISTFDITLTGYGVSPSGLLKAKGIVRTLVAAAKINYWQSNHHFGDNNGKVRGALLNALNATNMWKESMADNLKASYLTALKYSVHPFSTVHMLGMLGWGPIRARSVLGLPYYYIARKDAYISIRANEDNIPAGSRKWGLCREFLKQFRRRGVLAFLPNISRIDEVHDNIKEIKERPVRYHMGSRFLCGLPTLCDQNGECVSEILGLGAQYISKVNARSTLAKAPAVQYCIRNQDGFDDRWGDLVDAFVAAKGLPVHKKLIALLKGGSTSAFDEQTVTAYIENDDNTAKAVILELKKQLDEKVASL